jgi:hypothetical protein
MLAATAREMREYGMHRYKKFGTLVSEIESCIRLNQLGLRGIGAGKNEENPE